MGASWSRTRKRLEEDLLCSALRGRVQYFFTIYHKAPDQYGRFALRLDGKEVFRAHPYTEGRIWELEEQIKQTQHIPPRVWTDKGVYLHDAENRQAEEEARLLAAEEGTADSFDVSRLIQQYLNQSIEESLASPEPVVRMFAVLDRRVGRRRLARLAEELSAQPRWLQRFYRLRLEAEGLPLPAEMNKNEEKQA